MRKPGDVIASHQLENHPQFNLILQAIVNGQSATEIREWAVPKPGRMTLNRFRKSDRISKALSRASTAPVAMAQALQAKGLLPDTAEVAEVVAATSALMAGDDPLLRRITRHQDIIDRGLDDPKIKIGSAVALINTDLKGIELYAKLTHRLDAPQTGVNITIVNPQPSRGNMGQSPIIDIGVGE